MKKGILSAIIIFMPLIANAYDVEIDGVYYNLDAEKKVAVVTFQSVDAKSYAGDVVIPETILYNEVSYPVVEIGYHSFYNCTELTSVKIPESVTKIEELAFYRCITLKSITIPDAVTSIGRYAFSYCNALTTLAIPNSVIDIGHSTFEGCTNITSVALSNSLQHIGQKAFHRCTSLQSITIPESVTRIDDMAFSKCSELRTVSIPKSLTDYSAYIFEGCNKLETVYCYSENAPSIPESVFLDCDCKNATLYVPAASVNEYKSTSPWTLFGTILPIGETDIAKIKNEGETNGVTRYTPDGKMVNCPTRGLNIIRSSNGKTQKVIVK